MTTHLIYIGTSTLSLPAARWRPGDSRRKHWQLIPAIRVTRWPVDLPTFTPSVTSADLRRTTFEPEVR